MLTVRRLPALGLTALVVLLAAVWATVGLSAAGWVVGLVCGVVVNTVVAQALGRAGSHGPGPADLVTLTRAVITCAVAGLTADELLHQSVTPLFVPIAIAALVLDAVDGWVARRTRTSSAFGSRFDGEVDAFVILVLSVYVAPVFGTWILAAGLARYAFGMAGWVMPWMRARLNYRYWRKVVTATQGIVLVVAAADVLPRWLTTGALVVGLALLAESFGRDVCWLWSHRRATAGTKEAVDATAPVRLQPRRERV
jgi:phosphatidylglycerophosphate synthase